MRKQISLAAAVAIAIACSFVALLWGLIVGADARGEHMQRQAVDAGVAEYYLDDNFNRQWRWLNREP